MADPTIIEIVRQYLRNLAGQGILPRMGVIFGSHASGHPGQSEASTTTCVTTQGVALGRQVDRKGQ